MGMMRREQVILRITFEGKNNLADLEVDAMHCIVSGNFKQ
jgi:hypothetical protein